MKNILVFISLICLKIIIVHSVIISNVDESIHDKILNNFLTAPKKELFKVYHFLYKKEYDLNSEEGLSRYKTFKENLKLIEETNSKNLSYKLGIGPFTDLTKQEFRQNYLGRPRTKALEIPNSSEFNPQFLKGYTPGSLSIDYRSYFREPISQGSCGSCWAFGAIASIEGNYSLKFGKKIRLSPQNLLECDKNNSACNGGYEPRTFDYIKQNGIADDTSYPYTSGSTKEVGTCKENINRYFILEGYETCQFGKCGRDKFIALLQKGPLSVGIDGEGNGVFSNYKSGIIDMPCSTINHAINIVGIGNDPKEGDYYIGRNSWGSWWGEGGYFRIKFRNSDDTCFIEREAFLVNVKESNLPFPPPPKPECAKIYPSCNFQGVPYEVCQNLASFDSSYKGLALSYTLGRFKSIRYFTSDYCRSDHYHDDAEEKCISGVLSQFANNIKSVVLEDGTEPPNGCLWLYDFPCLTGLRFEICSSIDNLETINFANRVSSIKIGKGIKSYELYADVNYKGNKIISDSDKYAIEIHMDNDIESIKIVK